MVSILSNVSSSRKQSLFQVEVCKKEKVWYVVTVLVNTICNGKKIQLVGQEDIETKNRSQVKARHQSFFTAKHYKYGGRFSLLVGYNI